MTDEFDRQKWAHELARRDAERAHDRHDEHWALQNKSAIEAANLALKSAILINGGAAISVLTFIGSLAAQGRVATNQINDVASSLLWFASGVATALTATAAAYIINLLNADGMATKKKVWNHPYIEETPLSKGIAKTRVLIHCVALVVGLSSIGCFVKGILEVKDSISRLSTSIKPTETG